MDLQKEAPTPDAVIDMFLQELRLANVGIASIVQRADHRTNLRVEECAACSGMPPAGTDHCHYISGLFTGLFQSLGHTNVRTNEVKCWVKGDRFCEFQVDYSD
jgi:predicted hydrocarbon binding protein